MSEQAKGTPVAELREELETFTVSDGEQVSKEEWTERFLDRLRDVINGWEANPFTRAFEAGDVPEALANDVVQLLIDDDERLDEDPADDDPEDDDLDEVDMDDELDGFRSVWNEDPE